MVYIKKWFVILFFIFISVNAHAYWNPALAHAGFLGRYNLGAIKHIDDNHSLEFSLGSYAMDRRQFYQINFGYAYSPWLIKFSQITIEPFRFGPYALYALDNNNYFLQVPDRYVARNYYQQNGLHLALHFGAAIKIKENLRFILFTMVLDDAFVIMYNNPGEDIGQTFLSTGIILEWML